MELREGYKQTDLGVMPIDWLVKKLSDIATSEGGYAFKSDKFSTSGTFQVIKMSNLYGGNLNLERSSSFLTEIDDVERHYLLKENDILITLTGTVGKKDYGYTYRICNEKNLLLNQRVARITTRENNSSILLFFHTKMSYFLAPFFESGKGGTGNQTNVGTKDIDAIKIPVPPTLEEQTAIATAINDADELITTLEKLIAKKRNIKQGAMQQLLQPKEGWEVRALGDVFAFKQGVQCPVESQYLNNKMGLTRFIRIIDLTQPSEPPRFIEDPGISHHITPDDLFMVRYGNPGLLGFGYEGVIANNLFRLLPKIRIHSSFFYHLLSSKESDILQLSSSTTMAALNFTSLKGLYLGFPLEIAEQIRIGNILSDMDAEIAALQAKLEKYKQIKQGMMQNLLTGKIRLI